MLNVYGYQGYTEQVKGQLQGKMKLWSNNTLVPSRPFSGICKPFYLPNFWLNQDI